MQETMRDYARERFFAELADQLDYWVSTATDSATISTSDLTWTRNERSFRLLQEALKTTEQREAFRGALRESMRGLVHSVLVALDGGTALADEVRLTLKTADGNDLGPALHEFFYEYLVRTGR